MGVVAEIERTLADERCRQGADQAPTLRTSTMTHLVWAPPRWLDRAKGILAGLEERHPARTIFLVPLPGRSSSVEADAVVRDFELGGGREVMSEVIEVTIFGPGFALRIAQLRTAQHLKAGIFQERTEAIGGQVFPRVGDRWAKVFAGRKAGDVLSHG